MKKTICLNMIIKDEYPIIRRCLDSVKKIIDYWVIVDTGSTDGTQQVVLECMRDIPGELHERKWVDFGSNRNEALQLAMGKGDYLLFIDADEQLIFEKGFVLPELNMDGFLIDVHQEGNKYRRLGLVDNRLNWSWIGVLHEAIHSPLAKKSAVLKGVVNLSITSDGHRYQDPDKYLKDAAILERALQTDPENARYVFYLAISYGNAKEYALALKYHRMRAEMGGWEEEVFMSLYNIGGLQDLLDEPSERVIESYTKAHLFRPTRAEPLYWLAKHYAKRGNFLMGYLVSGYALPIPIPTDALWVQHPIYKRDLPELFKECLEALTQALSTSHAL